MARWQPKTQPWRTNANGVIRSPQEAIEIARKHGVEIPDDIQFFREAKTLPADTFAEYMSRRYSPGQLVRWEDFDNQYDNIAVKVSKEVLSSDEAIVSIVAHEMHELNNLRRLFDESGGAMTSERLGRLINPGSKETCTSTRGLSLMTSCARCEKPTVCHDENGF